MKNQIDEITESKRSLKIYEKAYACYRPEYGESNAESAERHELIAAKVLELKEQRKPPSFHNTYYYTVESPTIPLPFTTT